MLLIAAGSLWLFLAAIPVLADGGPHVASANSGVSTLTADGCAGCHRAHTAQGYNLLASPDEEALCLSCHGAAGTGATTDVESGVQYTLANDGTGTQPVLGALRDGGFVEARINSADPYRIGYMRSATAVSFHTKVSVLASGQPVTSAHLDLDGAGGVVATGVAWGNIAGTPGATFDATDNPGGTVSGMTCASCHNPHGNGNYRILNPIPSPETTTGDTFAAATVDTVVTDAALPGAGETRNYTVIQTQGGTGTLLASDVAGLSGYSNAMGDYFHRTVPWDPQVDNTIPPPTGVTSGDSPNGQATFNAQITAWCAQCHSRYLANDTTSIPQQTDSGDATFTYRHGTNRSACTTCHVAHGSNAAMTGTFSSDFPYPDASTSASSRLLKVDNRGTCQACHDPTGTIVADDTTGTVPAPYVP
jgi:predicted CXXCH cytochrome family protein